MFAELQTDLDRIWKAPAVKQQSGLLGILRSRVLSLGLVLVWVYYSAQIFLLGAEFTWVYAHRFGSRRHEERPATAKESLGAPESAVTPKS